MQTQIYLARLGRRSPKTTASGFAHLGSVLVHRG